MSRLILVATLFAAIISSTVCLGAKQSKGPSAARRDRSGQTAASVSRGETRKLSLPKNEQVRRARAWLSEIYSQELRRGDSETVDTLLAAADRAAKEPRRDAAVEAALLFYAAEVAVKSGDQYSAVQALNEFESRFNVGRESESFLDGHNEANASHATEQLMTAIKGKDKNETEYRDLVSWLGRIKDNMPEAKPGATVQTSASDK